MDKRLVKLLCDQLSMHLAGIGFHHIHVAPYDGHLCTNAALRRDVCIASVEASNDVAISLLGIVEPEIDSSGEEIVPVITGRLVFNIDMYVENKQWKLLNQVIDNHEGDYGH